MFRPLGLLAHVACPGHRDGQCHSASCVFGHKDLTANGSRTKSLSAARDKQGVGKSLIRKPVDTRVQDTDQPAQKRARVGANGEVDAEIDAIRTSSKQDDVRQETSPPGSQNKYPAPLDSPHHSGPSSRPVQAFSITEPEEDEGTWTVVSRKRPGPSAPSELAPGPYKTYHRAPLLSFISHPVKSQISLSSRNAALTTLWNHFKQAYNPLVRADIPLSAEAVKMLAFQDAQAQEKEIFLKASKASYRPSIVSAVTSIKKRNASILSALAAEFIPTRFTALAQVVDECRKSCSEVGTNVQVNEKRKEQEEQIKLRLTQKRLVELCFICPPSLLGGDSSQKNTHFGYDVPPVDGRSPDEAWGKGGSEPHAAGEERTCSRCSAQFIVGGRRNEHGNLVGQDDNVCYYHWGKKYRKPDPSLTGGRSQVARWLCCGKLVDASTLGPTLSELAGYGGPRVDIEGDEFCSVGPHVFSEYDDVAQLHRREAYVSTTELHSEMLNSRPKGYKVKIMDIAALDCEMANTTAGVSVVRVTLVDQDGNTVLDELIRPPAEIIDANTRFSGVTKADINGPKVRTLPEVRRQLAHYIGPKTILIGHGLENDLRALRLFHSVIVDTALLFPHLAGLPVRHALKFLAERFLHRTIQEGDGTFGHSPEEDALTALDLVKWKAVYQPTSPFMRIDARVQEADMAVIRSTLGLEEPVDTPSSANIGVTIIKKGGLHVAAGTSSQVHLQPGRAPNGSQRPVPRPPRSFNPAAPDAGNPSSSPARASEPRAPSLFIPKRR